MARDTNKQNPSLILPYRGMSYTCSNPHRQRSLSAHQKKFNKPLPCKSISPCNCRAFAKCELGQDSRDEGAVIRDSVEHNGTEALYLMEDMTSAEVREKLRNCRKRRTGFKVGGMTLNMSVHVGVDSPVEDRVPLCNSEGNQVYRILFYISLYLNISSYNWQVTPIRLAELPFRKLKGGVKPIAKITCASSLLFPSGRRTLCMLESL